MTYTTDEILAWSSQQVQNWLETLPSDEKIAWLALGEAAAMAANSASTDIPFERRDTLGQLAVYALKMATHQDPSMRYGALLSEIVLRSGLIHRVGVEPGSVRDPALLWPLLERVLEEADALRIQVTFGPVVLSRTSLAKMLLLRRAKSVLRAAELVLKSDRIVRPPTIDWWWNRREHLP